MSDLSDRLERCYASAVHDVLREMGFNHCVLPPEISLLDPTKRLAGEIFTVAGQVDMTLDRHQSLLLWARVLSKAPDGKVIVCQPHTRAVALMGELSAHALRAKNTRGYVVDGHARDVEQLAAMEFPIAYDRETAADIVERWRYTALGEPIAIGDVTIRTGDYIVVDRDGGVVIPQEVAEEAITRTEATMATESEMRQAIIAGMDPEAAYLKFGKF